LAIGERPYKKNIESLALTQKVNLLRLSHGGKEVNKKNLLWVLEYSINNVTQII
jgi:hypothetical protein